MPLSKTRMKGSETVFLSFVQFILINCCHTTLYVLYFIRPSSSDSGNLTRPLCILRPHRDTRCHWCAASETTQPHSAAELQLFHKDRSRDKYHKTLNKIPVRAHTLHTECKHIPRVNVCSHRALVCVRVMTWGAETTGGGRAHAKEFYSLSTWWNTRLIKRADLWAVWSLLFH